jgi:chemotaxis response regulator CheB
MSFKGTLMIKILIADDHPTMRNGLKVFLENFDDMQLVGEAASGTEAVDLCRQLQPDVVLMDLLMPHMDGVTATKLILEHCPDTKVILMSGSFQGNLKKQHWMQAHTTTCIKIETLMRWLRQYDLFLAKSLHLRTDQSPCTKG